MKCFLPHDCKATRRIGDGQEQEGARGEDGEWLDQANGAGNEKNRGGFAKIFAIVNQSYSNTNCIQTTRNVYLAYFQLVRWSPPAHFYVGCPL